MAGIVKITEVRGTAVSVEGNDIDTDRIMPARFLKEITFANMGKYAFYDERYDDKGSTKPHPFNDAKYAGANILVANKNFGCGSSREHAPQAILRYGIKAIVAESFAEIFAGNCLMLGMPTVTASETDIAKLTAMLKENPKAEIRLSLTEQKLFGGGGAFAVRAPDVVLKALTEGTWDSTRLLLSNMGNVRETAKRIPYLRGFVPL